VLLRFRNKFLINVIDVIISRELVCVVQEFVECGTIGHVAGVISEAVVVKYTQQLIQILQVMERNQIVAQVLSVDNVFLTKAGIVKL
jgi:serine/threonine protein kinase